MADRMTGIEARLDAVEAQLSEIAIYITGARKVWGMAAKNWKKVLIFGCGVVTSAGIGNPQVQSVLKFVAGFLA